MLKASHGRTSHWIEHIIQSVQRRRERESVFNHHLLRNCKHTTIYASSSLYANRRIDKPTESTSRNCSFLLLGMRYACVRLSSFHRLYDAGNHHLADVDAHCDISFVKYGVKWCFVLSVGETAINRLSASVGDRNFVHFITVLCSSKQ